MSEQARIAIERRRHRARVTQDEGDVEACPRESGVVLEQGLDAVQAPAERGVDQPPAALLAIAADRFDVGQHRRPRREAQVPRDGVLGVGETRRAIGAQPRERLGVPGAGRAQELLGPATRLIEVDVHHDHLHRAWCPQSRRARWIASDVTRSCEGWASGPVREPGALPGARPAS